MVPHQVVVYPLDSRQLLASNLHLFHGVRLLSLKPAAGTTPATVRPQHMIPVRCGREMRTIVREIQPGKTPMRAQKARKGTPQLSSDQRKLLLAKAQAALKQAYAPFSRFRVGAAVLTEAGNIFHGCNVENASYGLTNCAERTAIFSAVAAEGPQMRLCAVAVWSDPKGPCAPCGACRQVIFEFGPDALVIFQGKNGIKEARACELLPGGFHF